MVRCRIVSDHHAFRKTHPGWMRIVTNAPSHVARLTYFVAYSPCPAAGYSTASSLSTARHDHAMKTFRTLENMVLGWTAFTTVFLWTVTNRGLWRPTISSASIGAEGSGRTLTFWILLSLAPLALGLFYLHGRHRLRPVFWGLLLSWHSVLAIVAVSIAASTGGTARFIGGTWGWNLPMRGLSIWLVVTALAAALYVFADAKRPAAPKIPWGAIGWRRLTVAAALTPFIAVVFTLGQGYDWSARVGTATAIAQWLLALHALETGRPD
jgi:hypothetical protein